MIQEIFNIAGAVIISIGGGALLIFGLSSFLGKIWAERILLSEKITHEKELTNFKNQLELLSEQKSFTYKEKLELYKVVSLPIVKLVTLLSKEKGLTPEHLDEFELERLNITVQLALFAPKSVFYSFNEVIDYIYNNLENGKYTYSEFRSKALLFLSEMRKDIGLYNDTLEYHGTR